MLSSVTSNVKSMLFPSHKASYDSINPSFNGYESSERYTPISTNFLSHKSRSTYNNSGINMAFSVHEHGRGVNDVLKNSGNKMHLVSLNEKRTIGPKSESAQGSPVLRGRHPRRAPPPPAKHHTWNSRMTTSRDPVGNVLNGRKQGINLNSKPVPTFTKKTISVPIPTVSISIDNTVKSSTLPKYVKTYRAPSPPIVTSVTRSTSASRVPPPNIKVVPFHNRSQSANPIITGDNLLDIIGTKKNEISLKQSTSDSRIGQMLNHNRIHNENNTMHISHSATLYSYNDYVKATDLNVQKKYLQCSSQQRNNYLSPNDYTSLNTTEHLSAMHGGNIRGLVQSYESALPKLPNGANENFYRPNGTSKLNHYSVISPLASVLDIEDLDFSPG